MIFGSSRPGLRRWTLPAAMLLKLAQPAVAEPSPPPLDELMHRLAAVPESRAHFTEEKSLAALAQPVRGEGLLIYRRPGHLEKITTGPVPESLMVDDDRLSLVAAGEQPRVVELAEQPALAALVDAVRGTLSGDLPRLRRSYTVALEGDLSAWRLRLRPDAPALAALLREVVVDGADTALRSVRIVQANGDQSLLTIRP